MIAFIDVVARWSLPALLVIILTFAYLRGIDVYECFIEGAKEGFVLAVQILPYVVSIFVAIGIFRASGAMDLLTAAMGPLLVGLGIPTEVLPLALIRPLSGNGALALTGELLRQWGPDSYIGRLASTIQASTDTTFYVLSLYCGSVGITHTRHAVTTALLADLVGLLAAVALVRLAFGTS